MANFDPSILAATSDDPSSSYQALFDMQRKQMLAQMLMQRMQQVGQTPADWNSMRAVPRANPLVNGVAGIASALMARKGIKDAQQAEQNFYGTVMGGSQPSGSQTPSNPQNLQPAAPPMIRNPDLDQNAPEGAPIPYPQTPRSAPPGVQPQLAAGDFSPQGIFARAKQIVDSTRQGRILAYTDQAKYLEAIQNQAKALMPTGGERPGMPRYVGNQVVGYAPDPAAGVYYKQGPNGEPVAAPIQGQADIMAGNKAAAASAEYGAVPHEFPTQGGGTSFGYWNPNGQMRINSPLTNGTPQRQGAQSGPPDKWSDIPRLNIPTGLGKPDVYTDKRLSHAADKDAELATKYGEQSDMADQRIAFNNMALNVLKSAETGPLADRITKIKASAQEMGVPESMIPDWAKVSATQELKKDLVRNALVSLKPTFGARPAASEFQVLKEEANPSDQMTALAIRRLLTVDNESAQYQKQRANDYGEYRSRNGDPMRFESYYSRKFPVAPSLEAARAKVDAGNAPAAGYVSKGYRFKGGDPSKQENWEKVSK